MPVCSMCGLIFSEGPDCPHGCKYDDALVTRKALRRAVMEREQAAGVQPGQPIPDDAGPKRRRAKE